ncbi:MAG: citrate synthase [Lachnospiraceae bacterium]
MQRNFIAQTFGKSMNYTEIENHLFKEHNVKKGLRNEDGTGVCVGLTKVSDVIGYTRVDGEKVPAPGRLLYRGIDVQDLIQGRSDTSAGFEEVSFLLLFGFLPKKKELEEFRKMLQICYELPERYTELNFLTFPSNDLMNLLQSAVLSLYNFDKNPETQDVYEIVLKGINILAKMPMMMCYGYQSQQHYLHRKSLVIHYPKKEYSLAQNILYMLRDNSEFTKEEVSALDALLIVHAEHGGGNNSTFTNVVISSTGTDIYSSISGSIGSMKGPKHGGANIRCSDMIDAIIEEIGIHATEDEMRDIVEKVLNKKFFDKTGLFYGIGHAVYTQSDPRAESIKLKCKTLAAEKGRMDEYEFMVRLEMVAKEVVGEKLGKTVSNNVDFYSGFAYKMLNIPKEVYTPLFVCARTIGWVAHNIENRLYDGKIMRPATKCVMPQGTYVSIKER